MSSTLDFESSWADLVEEEENRKKEIAEEEKQERGKKLFIGGLSLTDTSNIQSDTIAEVVNQRIEIFKTWISDLGEVERYKEHFEERFGHD